MVSNEGDKLLEEELTALQGHLTGHSPKSSIWVVWVGLDVFSFLNDTKQSIVHIIPKHSQVLNDTTQLNVQITQKPS